MIVVGGGVIGTEYASMLAALGVRVTLIEGRDRLLDFIDKEITEALQYHLRQAGVTLRLGEKVVKIDKRELDPKAPRPVGHSGHVVEATLESGKTLTADSLLYCVGRQGCTDGLNLAAAGVSADNRGRITVNKHYQTSVPHIYAAGDVIGFPALASTSMEQGRLAACHMFGSKSENFDNLLPYGIYSIPEISIVGWTEEKLTADAIPYEAGIAYYKETARGQLLGDDIGMLKMLIHQESKAVLGVHIIGTNATELVHIGQCAIAFKATADYFVNTVFNYPTLAECYKIAALNGLNKLGNV
jgi:NAD(P) transhydrogenase